MKIPRPFALPDCGDEEIKEVADVIKSGWLTTASRCAKFEEDFARSIGAKYAVAVNSPIAALHLALKARGIKSGDEVIIPANTFIATAEVVTYFGAVPALCDIEEETQNMDVSKIEGLSERLLAQSGERGLHNG